MHSVWGQNFPKIAVADGSTGHIAVTTRCDIYQRGIHTETPSSSSTIVMEGVSTGTDSYNSCSLIGKTLKPRDLRNLQINVEDIKLCKIPKAKPLRVSQSLKTLDSIGEEFIRL